MSDDFSAPKYIRPQDVAKKYSVSPEFVYKSIKSGDLKARKFAKNVWLILPEDAERWESDRFAAMEQAG